VVRVVLEWNAGFVDRYPVCKRVPVIAYSIRPIVDDRQRELFDRVDTAVTDDRDDRLMTDWNAEMRQLPSAKKAGGATLAQRGATWALFRF
jgi:hypothetical protein